MVDFVQQTFSFTTELNDKVAPTTSKLMKLWSGFSTLFDKSKKSINKGFDSFSKGANKFEKSLKGIGKTLQGLAIVESIKGIREAVSDFQGAKGIDGATEGVETFNKNTTDTAKILGLTREGTLALRDAARLAGTQFSSSAVDMDAFGAAMEQAAKEGVKNQDTLIAIGTTAALISKNVGSDGTEIADVFFGLNKNLGLSEVATQRLLVGLTELRNPATGLNVNFQELLETVKSSIPEIEAGFGSLSAVVKEKVIKSLVGVQAAVETAFGDDAQGFVKDLISQVAAGTGPLVNALGGVEEARSLLEKGDTAGILAQIGEKFRGITTPEGLKAAGEAFGISQINAQKFNSQLASMIESGNTVNAVLGDTSKSLEDVAAATDEAQSFSQKLISSFKTFVATSPNIGATLDLIEEIGPAVQLAASSAILLQALVGAMASLGLITKIASAATLVFNFVLAANPVVLIVIAVVALIAALLLFVPQLKPVREFLVGFFNFLVDGVKVAIDWVSSLSQWFLVLLGPIGLVILAIKNFGAIWEFVLSSVNAVLGVIKELFNFNVIDPINAVITFDTPLGSLGSLIGIPEGIPRLITGGAVRETGVAVVDKGEVILNPGQVASLFGAAPAPIVNVEMKLDELVTEMRGLRKDLKSASSNVAPGIRNPRIRDIAAFGGT